MRACRALRDRGVSCETLCLHLLAPAARHLGELWSEDVCDFSEVTIGLWHLHQVLHHLHPALPDYDTVRSTRRRAVLVPLPGEQHSFGAMMVAEFFRRAGWSVWSGPFADNDDLLGLVAGEWFGMVGLSAAGEIRFAGLSQLIRAIRRVSRNRSVRIMVGGPLFNAQPDLACRVGADATATDGRIAVAHAERMLALRLQIGRRAGHRRLRAAFVRLDEARAAHRVKLFAAPEKTLGSLDADTAAIVLSATADMALIVDGKGVIRDVAFGRDDLQAALPDSEASVGRRWMEVVTVESRSKVQALLREAASNGAPRWRHVNYPSHRDSDEPVLHAAVQTGQAGRVLTVGRSLGELSALQQRLVSAQQSLERDYLRFRNAETRYRMLFSVFVRSHPDHRRSVTEDPRCKHRRGLIARRRRGGCRGAIARRRVRRREYCARARSPCHRAGRRRRRFRAGARAAQITIARYLPPWSARNRTLYS